MKKPFLEVEEQEAAAFQERLKARRLGTHRPKKIPREAARTPKVTRFLIIGDSHAHWDVPNNRFEWLGRMIASKAPDVVVDIGDSADLPSLMDFDKARPAPIFEGFNALWRDVDAYMDAQDRLMGEVAKSKHKPLLYKTLGNHEYRLTKAVKYEPRLRGFVGPELLCERDYGWKVTEFGQILSVRGANFCHMLPGGGSKMGPRGVVRAHPGTAGVYCYGHVHRRGVYMYSGLKPSNGAIISVGCYFDPNSSSHAWAGENVLTWHPGIQEITVDSQGRLRGEKWYDYEEVRQLWG